MESTPFSPPSGPVRRRPQGPPSKSKFLAAKLLAAYGFEWTADQAVWSIDGTVVHTLARTASRAPAQWPDEEMYIILNNGVRSSSPDATTTWPNRVEVDYIEVYQKP